MNSRKKDILFLVSCFAVVLLAVGFFVGWPYIRDCIKPKASDRFLAQWYGDEWKERNQKKTTADAEKDLNTLEKVPVTEGKKRVFDLIKSCAFRTLAERYFWDGSLNKAVEYYRKWFTCIGTIPMRYRPFYFYVLSLAHKKDMLREHLKDKSTQTDRVQKNYIEATLVLSEKKYAKVIEILNKTSWSKYGEQSKPDANWKFWYGFLRSVAYSKMGDAQKALNVFPKGEILAKFRREGLRVSEVYTLKVGSDIALDANDDEIAYVYAVCAYVPMDMEDLILNNSWIKVCDLLLNRMATLEKKIDDPVALVKRTLNPSTNPAKTNSEK